MIYKQSIRDMHVPWEVEDAEIVSDRIMFKGDEVVLRNREEYAKTVLKDKVWKATSCVYAGTGFKNCKTNSKTICEAQMCFVYIANLEFVRYSKRQYPIYKVVNEPVYDGYEEGIPCDKYGNPIEIDEEDEEDEEIIDEEDEEDEEIIDEEIDEIDEEFFVRSGATSRAPFTKCFSLSKRWNIQ